MNDKSIICLDKVVVEYKENDFIKYTSVEALLGYKNIAHLISRIGSSEVDSIFFNVTENISSNKIQIKGIEYINYAGYNYLGFSGEAQVTEAAINAIKKFGTSVSASRLVAGEKPINISLEAEIADFIGVEDALVFSAGHATNVSVISHLFGEKDLIIHDSLIHNSALQGAIFSGAKYSGQLCQYQN